MHPLHRMRRSLPGSSNHPTSQHTTLAARFQLRRITEATRVKCTRRLALVSSAHLSNASIWLSSTETIRDGESLRRSYSESSTEDREPSSISRFYPTFCSALVHAFQSGLRASDHSFHLWFLPKTLVFEP